MMDKPSSSVLDMVTDVYFSPRKPPTAATMAVKPEPAAEDATGAKLSGTSLKDKVSAIKAELGIDEANQGRAIKQANEMLGITATGNFVSQVDELCKALDIQGGVVAAGAAA